MIMLKCIKAVRLAVLSGILFASGCSTVQWSHVEYEYKLIDLPMTGQIDGKKPLVFLSDQINQYAEDGWVVVEAVAGDGDYDSTSDTMVVILQRRK
jgi:hypothetical protein